MVKAVCVVAVLVGLLFGVLVLAGCDSAADKTRAEAEAYQVRVAADTAAASERAAIREAERQAGHERIVELLPFMALIIGGLGLAGLGLVVWSDIRSRPRLPSVDPTVLLLLDADRRRLADVERAAWRLVVAEQRRRLATGERRVTVYDDRGDQVTQ